MTLSETQLVLLVTQKRPLGALGSKKPSATYATHNSSLTPLWLRKQAEVAIQQELNISSRDSVQLG